MKTIETIGRMKSAVGDHQLEYLVQSPAGDRPDNGWPLVLFLHGYGECGSDIDKIRAHGPPKLVNRFDQLAKCVIVSPQCPQDSWWQMEALKALVDEVITNRGDIDTTRLYVTGLSMGGYGVWSFISHYPDYFGAAIPICGGGDPFRLPLITEKAGIANEFDPAGLTKAVDLPIWTFHGANDSDVPIAETEMLVGLLEEAGHPDIRFTTYENAGHVETWEMAYGDVETWDWLFAQQR